MRQAAYNIRLPGWVWSLVLAAEALNRVSSFLERPPMDNGLAPVLDVHPFNWVLLLTVGASLLIVGIGAWLSGVSWAPWLVVVGHLILTCCCLTFTVSIIGSAIEYGEPWSGAGPLVVLTLLHCERTLCAGTNIGRR